MKVNLEEARSVNLLVDEEKNIAIFPISKSDFPVTMPDGTVYDFWYYPAFAPIELKMPYTAEMLADKIREGIEQWDQHPCYRNFSGRNTFEEKYYGIKGFKNAMKGKLDIHLGWDDISGKYVWLDVPNKRGYACTGIDQRSLPEDADWIDFANAVIELINEDLTKLDSFKVYKSKLNLAD